MTTSDTPIDHDGEKSRSYGVRASVLGLGVEGRDGTGFAVTRRLISNYAVDHPQHVEIPAGTRCRVRTSNAGFRGIECSAEALEGPAEGSKVYGVSLGAFDAEKQVTG